MIPSVHTVLSCPLQWWKGALILPHFWLLLLLACHFISLGKIPVSFCSFRLWSAKYSAPQEDWLWVMAKNTRVDMWRFGMQEPAFSNWSTGIADLIGWTSNFLPPATFTFVAGCDVTSFTGKGPQGRWSVARCAPLSCSPLTSGIDLATPN